MGRAQEDWNAGLRPGRGRHWAIAGDIVASGLLTQPEEIGNQHFGWTDLVYTGFQQVQGSLVLQDHLGLV